MLKAIHPWSLSVRLLSIPMPVFDQQTIDINERNKSQAGGQAASVAQGTDKLVSQHDLLLEHELHCMVHRGHHSHILA